MDEHKKIIEINGVKLEVDLRQAKVISSYKVGDSIKLLKKEYDCWKVYPGVIVGFTEFKNLPTIEILYLDYSAIAYTIFNSETKTIEIAAFNKYEVMFSKSDIIAKLDVEIHRAEEDLRDKKQRKKAFLETFSKAFKDEMITNEVIK